MGSPDGHLKPDALTGAVQARLCHSFWESTMSSCSKEQSTTPIFESFVNYQKEEIYLTVNMHFLTGMYQANAFWMLLGLFACSGMTLHWCDPLFKLVWPLFEWERHFISVFCIWYNSKSQPAFIEPSFWTNLPSFWIICNNYCWREPEIFSLKTQSKQTSKQTGSTLVYI